MPFDVNNHFSRRRSAGEDPHIVECLDDLASGLTAIMGLVNHRTKENADNIAEMTRRIVDLENRILQRLPAPAASNISPLEKRIAAIERIDRTPKAESEDHMRLLQAMAQRLDDHARSIADLKATVDAICSTVVPVDIRERVA